MVQAGAEITKETDKTDHGPKVVCHLLSVLKNSPQEQIPPRMFALLVWLSQVLLAVEQSSLCWLLLEHVNSTPRSTLHQTSDHINHTIYSSHSITFSWLSVSGNMQAITIAGNVH